MEQDGETLLRLWTGWGKDKNELRRGLEGDNEDLQQRFELEEDNGHEEKEDKYKVAKLH